MDFSKILEYIVDRLKERATWNSLSVAATGMGIAVKPDQWQAIMTIGMGVAGIVTAFLPPHIQEKTIIPASPEAPTTPLAQSMADKVASGQTETIETKVDK